MEIKKLNYGWGVKLAVLLIICVQYTVTITSPILGTIMEAFPEHASMVKLLETIPTFAAVIISILLGPLMKVFYKKQLLLFGNVQLTPPALFLLLREGVDTVLLRRDGRYMGRLADKEPANIFLRKKQFALAEDTAFRTRTARRIVQGKLLNQATVLARIKRSRGQEAAGNAARELRLLADKAEQAHDVESLRGLEGSGAACYFRYLPLAFNQEWGFSRRVRRPPTDPVNAVLSLLYTLLINRCCAAIRIAGLDPYPACLHTAAYGRQSLPLDLVEEFRAMLADTLTISLFNMRMLHKEDFETPLPETDPDDLEKNDELDAVLRDPIGLMTPENAVVVYKMP